MIGDTSVIVRKVRRDKIIPCLTCPLCHQLYNEATTISECLHTFCKKCIHDKIINDDLDRCPVCNVYLGTSPLDKLRMDNNLEDIRTKIFGALSGKKGIKEQQPIIQTKMVKPPELVQSKKKKEKPISCLVDSLPNTPMNQKITAKKRSKSGRKNNPLHASTANYSPSLERGKNNNVEQCCPKNEIIMSSKPSVTENVGHNNQVSNDEDKEVVMNPRLKVCDLNQHPTIIEDDSSGQSSKSTTNANQIEEVYLLKKNKNDVLQAKSKKPRKKTLASKSQLNQTKHNIGDDITQNLAKKVDLNKPPDSPIANATKKSSITHTTKKVMNNTHEVRNKGKGIIIEDNDYNDNDNDNNNDNDNDSAEDDDDKYLATIKKKTRKNASKSKGKGKMVDEDYSPTSESLPLRSIRKSRNKREKKVGNNNNKSQAPPKEAEVEHDDEVLSLSTIRPAGVMVPVWLSLLPSQDPERGAPLPEMRSPYLRVKDPNMPVSVLRKYVARNLNIANEYEVEIMMHGHPVVHSLRVCNLLDVWCQTAPNRAEEIEISVGSSAKDLVMTLTYARKVASP